VQRDRELDHAEIGREVPPRPGHAFEHEGAQLIAQDLALAPREATQLRRVIHAFQHRVVRRRHILFR